MRTIGNILWFIFGGLLGGLAWVLQDAYGVLQLLEFRQVCSVLNLRPWHSGRLEKKSCMEMACFRF